VVVSPVKFNDGVEAAPGLIVSEVIDPPDAEDEL
jgi:hypothetical protein